MKTSIKLPELIYPALAICSHDGEKPTETLEELHYDIVLISEIIPSLGMDSVLYASFVFGKKESYRIKEIEHYYFLPKGTKIIIEQ